MRHSKGTRVMLDTQPRLRQLHLGGASGRIYAFTLCPSLHHLPESPGLFAYLAVPPDQIAPPRALFFGRAECGLSATIPRHEKFEPAIRLGLNAYAVLPMRGLLGDVQEDLVAGTPTALNLQRDALREISELTESHRRLTRRVAAE